MSSVTFLNPPFLKMFSRSQRSPAVTKSGTLYFPMWLAYAAGYAEQEGHNIDLIDAPADGMEPAEVLNRLRDFGADLVVVDTSTPSIYNDADFCQSIKEVLPEAFVLLVGTHVSALPEESLALNDAVDAVAIGEFDLTVRELADSLESGNRELQAITGLCFNSEQGVVNTGPRELLVDLDQLPFVSKIYKRFLNIEKYFNPNALFPMVTITTSRGCPHRCIFCVYPQTMMGHKVRLRSVDNVVDEIEYIKENFPGVKAIFFEDDTFPANRKRCVTICQEMIRRRINISWTANARADLDYETMQVMKDSGCRCMCVGFESGSQLLLDNIKKKIKVDNTQAFMSAARKAGILIHGCFMVGHPGETRETMEQTLKLAIKLNPESIQVYPVMVYPGTAAFRWYDERNLIKTKDFSKWITPSGLHNTVIRGEELTSEELVQFCDDARRAFYLRPGYFIYKLVQMVKQPREIRRNLKSAKTFLKYLLQGSDVDEKCGCDKK